MPLLEAIGLAKEYRSGRAIVPALAEVSLTIPRGSFVVLSGPSGAGKTTLLALLGALERPTRGQVRFDGTDLTLAADTARARARRRMGFIFQDFALVPGLPVWENITYPLIPRGLGPARRRQLAREWLGRLGIADKEQARPAELSGGEQQRVAAARAFAGTPEVLFADEPTSNLDPDSARVLLEVLREFHAARSTVVVATHDPQLVALATAVHPLSPALAR